MWEWMQEGFRASIGNVLISLIALPFVLIGLLLWARHRKRGR